MTHILHTQLNQQYLIIGLGNPGTEYKLTRHNIGFLCIDTLSRQHEIMLNRIKNNSLIGSGEYKGKKITLAKPQTYMNLSGRSVASLIKFYKLPLEHILIIHDDLDLPFGKIRIRPSGSSGGQKGIHSVLESLRTQEVPRVRVGIGRPPGRMDPMDYVLQKFNKLENSLLPEVIDRVCTACLIFIDSGIEQAMNRCNSFSTDKP